MINSYSLEYYYLMNYSLTLDQDFTDNIHEIASYERCSPTDICDFHIIGDITYFSKRTTINPWIITQVNGKVRELSYDNLPKDAILPYSACASDSKLYFKHVQGNYIATKDEDQVSKVELPENVRNTIDDRFGGLFHLRDACEFQNNTWFLVSNLDETKLTIVSTIGDVINIDKPRTYTTSRLFKVEDELFIYHNTGREQNLLNIKTNERFVVPSSITVDGKSTALRDEEIPNRIHTGIPLIIYGLSTIHCIPIEQFIDRTRNESTEIKPLLTINDNYGTVLTIKKITNTTIFFDNRKSKPNSIYYTMTLYSCNYRSESKSARK